MINKTFLLGGAIAMVGAFFLASHITSAKMPAGELVHFRLGKGGSAYRSGYVYSAILKGDELQLEMRYEAPKKNVHYYRYTKDKSFLTGLNKIIKEQEIYKWNGFKKSNKNVLDGYMFGLSVRYKNGDKTEEISASGSNSFPNNFNKGASAVASYFKENVPKLPGIKDTYTFEDVKPEIIEVWKYLQKQGVIKNSAPGEIYQWKATAHTDEGYLDIEAAIDPGHAFSFRKHRDKLLAIKVIAADGKKIEPLYFVDDYYNKLIKSDENKYNLRLMD